VAGFLDKPSPQRPLPLERLAASAAPVLAVVDYAETRTEQLTDLLRRLDAGDGAPVRLLLLARAAGDWWEQLARDLDCWGPVGDVHVLPTLDDAPADRDRAFHGAVRGLATALGRLPGTEAAVDWETRAAHLTEPPDLHQGRYGNPLTLQLVALLGLLDPDLPLGRGASPRGGGGAGAPERDLLTHHERKYWQHTAPRHPRLQPQVLDQAVTAATLCGAATSAEARALLAVLPGLSGQPENTVIAVGNWLRELYPAPPGQVWGALQPDGVGEQLIAATLADDPRILPALLGAAGRRNDIRQ
jgi:hypothetical protein